MLSVGIACSLPQPALRKLGPLAGITDPHDVMWAHDDLLFVTNSDSEQQRWDTLFVYSLEDLSLVGSIGGPALFQIQPAHSIELVVQPDRIVINGSGKVSMYDYDLALLDELEHPGNTYFFEPFGDSFVARQIHDEKVYGDELYIAGRTDDFLIEVFDLEGSVARRIEYDHDRVEVISRHWDEHMNGLMSRPG